MSKITNKEKDQLAIKYLELAAKAKGGLEEDIKIYKSYQNYCITKLSSLVLFRTARYRKFSNYPDLVQDGFEALLMSLKTFKPERGSFGGWASFYIKTKVSRQANAHSTIRIPIKKAQTIKPHKVEFKPIMIEGKSDFGMQKNPFEQAEENENSSSLLDAISSLPVDQQEVVNMTYGLNGDCPNTIGNVMNNLSITRERYGELLTQAKRNLKGCLNLDR